MELTTQIAKQLRDLYFGGNWTGSNFKEHLSDLTWQQATQQVHGFNTIVTLIYHTNYYIDVLTKKLHDEPLTAKDKYSFDHPPVESAEDWDNVLAKTWKDVEDFAQLIEQLPETKLWGDFWQNKYGNYYRNLHGIIEHSHYHLGQIVLIKKLVLQLEKNS
jgi:DinB superfamily